VNNETFEDIFHRLPIDPEDEATLFCPMPTLMNPHKVDTRLCLKRHIRALQLSMSVFEVS